MNYHVHIVTHEVTANTSVNTFSIEEAINVVCRKFNIDQKDIQVVTVQPNED